MNKPVKINFHTISTPVHSNKRQRKVTQVTTSEVANVVNSSEISTLNIDQYVSDTVSKLDSQIRPCDLHVDSSYQRATNIKRVQKIVDNFNPNAIGTIYLSMRNDESLHIIDGAHRVLALRQLGLEENYINAQVYFGLTPQQEAQLFVIMNESRVKPQPYEIHKAAVTSQDSVALEIDRILQLHGLCLVDLPRDNHVRAVANVYNLYSKMTPHAFSNVFKILKNANGSSYESFSVEYLVAVAIILIKYPHVDIDRLITTIAKLGHPKVVLNNIIAKSGGKITLFQKQIALASTIIDQYNSRLRHGRLDVNYIITCTHKNYFSPIR